MHALAKANANANNMQPKSDIFISSTIFQYNHACDLSDQKRRL